MAKDPITAKFITEADFATIQYIRHTLADPQAQAELISLLSDTLSTYLASKSTADFSVEAELKVSQERRTRAGPRSAIPKVQNGILSWYDSYAARTNVLSTVGSADWFQWLEEPHHTSFRYISKDQTNFTAIKRNDGKWYAHKRLNGKLKRRYLGLSENLTAKKMDEVAFELAQREITVE